MRLCAVGLASAPVAVLNDFNIIVLTVNLQGPCDTV